MTPHLEQQLSRTLDFLRSCQQKGMMPTKREIMEHLGISSTSVVEYYLKRLEERGKIERDPGKARGIRLTECEGEVVVIRDGYMGICWTCRKVCRTVTRELTNDWIENHKKKGKVK